MTMIILKVFLVGVICHCLASPAVQTKNESYVTSVKGTHDNLQGSQIVPRSLVHELFALIGKPVQKLQQSMPHLWPELGLSGPVNNICNSNCGIQHSHLIIPDNYTFIPGVGAHKIHSEMKNWNDARNICILEGGHLAVISSAAEDDHIRNRAIENKLQESWLGVHELFRNDDWTTVLDQPLDGVGYKHWMKYEPNHTGNNEHCVSYVAWNQNGNGMNDQNCEKHLPFFCEIRMN